MLCTLLGFVLVTCLGFVQRQEQVMIDLDGGSMDESAHRSHDVSVSPTSDSQQVPDENSPPPTTVPRKKLTAKARLELELVRITG